MRLLGSVESLQSEFLSLNLYPQTKGFYFHYSFLPDQESTLYNLLSIFSFPPHITAVFVQNASKIFAKIASNPETDERQFVTLCDEIEEMLIPYLKNQNLEIQERATNLSQIISIFRSAKVESLERNTQSIFLDGDDLTIEENGTAIKEDKGEEINNLKKNNEAINLESYFYAYPLNPVAAKAQRKVPIPVGLELDLPFLDEESDEEEIEEPVDDQGIHLIDDDEQDSSEVDEEEEKRRNVVNESRRFEQENNPHYLKNKMSARKLGKKKAKKMESFLDSTKVPETAEEAADVLSDYSVSSSSTSNITKRQTSIPGLVSSDRFLLNMKQSTSIKKAKVKPTKGKKKKAKEIEDEDGEDESPKVTIRALEMPEGADLNENDDDEDEYLNDAHPDPHRALAKVSLEDILDESLVEKHHKASKKSPKKIKSKILVNQFDGELCGDSSNGKKKSLSKSAKTSNNLNTREKVKSVKSGEVHDSNIVAPLKAKKPKEIKAKADSGVIKPPKKTTKKGKLKNSKNRAEYEETLGIETLSVA